MRKSLLETVIVFSFVQWMYKPSGCCLEFLPFMTSTKSINTFDKKNLFVTWMLKPISKIINLSLNGH